MHTLITLVGIIAVPGIACFYIPYRVLLASHVSFDQPFGLPQAIAFLMLSLGIYMILWVGVAFVRQGKGTPVPVDPPQHLVVSGLYCYVRNPMYVGAVLVVLAEALYFGSPWLVIYAAGLWAILHTAMLILEEPQLQRRFGTAYDEYQAQVPRWIPKLRANDGRSHYRRPL